MEKSFTQELNELRDNIANILETSYIENANKIKYVILSYIDSKLPKVFNEQEREKISNAVNEAHIKFAMRVENKLKNDVINGAKQ